MNLLRMHAMMDEGDVLYTVFYRGEIAIKWRWVISGMRTMWDDECGIPWRKSETEFGPSSREVGLELPLFCWHSNHLDIWWNGSDSRFEVEILSWDCIVSKVWLFLKWKFQGLSVSLGSVLVWTSEREEYGVGLRGKFGLKSNKTFGETGTNFSFMSATISGVQVPSGNSKLDWMYESFESDEHHGQIGEERIVYWWRNHHMRASKL